jgi:hypothetical protein
VDALDLLFRRLVLAAREAGALSRPLEVGEVLDRLAPYKAARRDGQVDTNDDYLHAMMRLLSGERGYVFADETIQDDLLAELASPNPDLTVLRAYRNTKVRLATAEAQRILEGDVRIDLRPPTPATPTTAVPGPARPSAPAPAMAAEASAPVPEPRASTGVVHPGCPRAQVLPELRA